MAKQADIELKKAFIELQLKMVETGEKIQIIDSQMETFSRILSIVVATQREVSELPPDTRIYDAVGRMFRLTNLDDVKNNLKNREIQLTDHTAELESNKQYLEKNLKESEDNIREMVQQKKEQSDAKAN